MNILVATVFFPPEFGGIQTLLLNLCRYTTVMVRVLAPQAKTKPFHDEIGHNVTVKRLVLRKKLGFIAFLYNTFITVKTEKIDAVFWGHMTQLVLTGWLAKRLWHIPLIVYVHGLDLARALDGNFVVRFINVFCLKNSDLVLTNCDYNRRIICSLGVPEVRVRILHPGVDPQIFHPGIDGTSVREEYDLVGKRILLTVSRLTKRKNHETVLKILPRLMEKIPDIVYVIVGEGSERANLEKLSVDLSINDRVRFVGSCSQQKLRQFYSLCDLFILVSKMLSLTSTKKYHTGDVEGFGIVFSEAGACAKPVIGGNSGGIPDAVVNGITGYLVDPEEPKEIEAAITDLLLDSEKSRIMGEKGRLRSLNELSWLKIGQQFDDYLQILLVKGKGRKTIHSSK